MPVACCLMRDAVWQTKAVVASRWRRISIIAAAAAVAAASAAVSSSPPRPQLLSSTAPTLDYLGHIDPRDADLIYSTQTISQR